jgi:hypothetical protein
MPDRQNPTYELISVPENDRHSATNSAFNFLDSVVS